MIDLEGIRAALMSHAAASGRFERVNGHEPHNAPGSGISAAVWLHQVLPSARQSGLTATSAVVIFNIRIYTTMLAEPQDDIDPRILGAADLLFTAYVADFQLGGTVAAVDVFGMAAGVGLQINAGHLEQDGKPYRVLVITLPLLVHDVWEQAP